VACHEATLNLACLQPKPRNLTIGKASLEFDALVGDRQVIANESFGVSRLGCRRNMLVRSVRKRGRHWSPPSPEDDVGLMNLQLIHQ
jgi:hypothetical protein